MKCNVCRSTLSGENSSIVPSADSSVYRIMFSCKAAGCGASHAFVMWFSEHEALQRHSEDLHDQQHKAALSALNEPVQVARPTRWFVGLSSARSSFPMPNRHEPAE